MQGVFVFILCLVVLISGYAFYGRLSEKVYGLKQEMQMPCVKMPDGVDYVPLPTWKIFMIQLLNIAGLGPVVGAVSGCLYGPVALLWIVLGCILAGAFHDFLAACMSAERDGCNLPELVGAYLGNPARHAMRCLCIFLMLMVGVVFSLLPAGMMHGICPFFSTLQWSILIIVYYFLATILPISAVIGKIYPLFAAIFLVMAIGLVVMLPQCGYPVLPDLDFFTNMHPNGISVWPMLFVTIACGAISGFHATQSPMMVRCLRSAGHMRRVFYGAMVVEGMVALVWATVGLTLRDVVLGESQTFAQMSLVNPSLAVKTACNFLLGDIGGSIAVIGVIVLAITSGDTAMRSCRLMMADVLKVKQVSAVSRLALAVPLFLIVILISQMDFSVIWRYFGWANQTLACITLSTITVCLRRRNRFYHLALYPALFMICMCVSFLCYAPECGINLSLKWATGIGGFCALVCYIAFYRWVRPSCSREC